jgi:hypothetical protein
MRGSGLNVGLDSLNSCGGLYTSRTRPQLVVACDRSARQLPRDFDLPLVCTENSTPDVVVMKAAEDRA